MSLTQEKPAQSIKSIESKRDWSRVAAWAWVGFMLGNFTHLADGVDMRVPEDVFLSTLLVAIGYALFGIVLGVIVTTITKKQTRSMTPFLTLGLRPSLMFVSGFAIIMGVRSIMYYNGVVGNAVWMIANAWMIYVFAAGRDRWSPQY